MSLRWAVRLPLNRLNQFKATDLVNEADPNNSESNEMSNVLDSSCLTVPFTRTKIRGPDCLIVT